MHTVAYAALAACLALGTLVAAQSAAREPIPESTAYVYRTVNETTLDLQVMRPPARFVGVRPAIVFFFGGGWSQGSVMQFVPYGKELTARGMVAVFVDYRVSSRHQSTPLQSTQDAQAAMRFVKRNAERLGINPQRIVAAGGSAGGQLALATTLVPALETDTLAPSANLLIGYNPVADLQEERWVKRFGGEGAAISPAAFVRKGMPPVLIFHGTADTTVPIQQVRDFCAAMRDAGNACLVEESQDAGHGFFNHGRHENRWYNEVVAKTIAFLAGHGYVE